MRVRSISIRLELLGWKKGRQSNKSRGIVKHIGNNYENEDEHPLTAQSQWAAVHVPEHIPWYSNNDLLHPFTDWAEQQGR